MGRLVKCLVWVAKTLIFLAAPAAWRQERPVLVMAASSAEERSAVKSYFKELIPQPCRCFSSLQSSISIV